MSFCFSKAICHISKEFTRVPGPGVHGFHCRFVHTTTVTRYRFRLDRWIRYYYYYYYNDRPRLRESRAGFFFFWHAGHCSSYYYAHETRTLASGDPSGGYYGRGEKYKTYLAANTCFGRRGGPIAIIIINNSTSI